jgi:hypothetical protein
MMFTMLVTTCYNGKCFWKDEVYETTDVDEATLARWHHNGIAHRHEGNDDDTEVDKATQTADTTTASKKSKK